MHIVTSFLGCNQNIRIPADVKSFTCFASLLVCLLIFPSDHTIAQGSDKIQLIEERELSVSRFYDEKGDLFKNFTTSAGDPLDQNFSDQFGVPGLNRFARAITEFNDTYCIGGDFTWYNAETKLNYIACFNEDENSWEGLGEGFNNPVHDLIVFDGELYAGGSFTASGENEINRVARWNGVDWEQVGDGFNGPVYTLTVFDGEIIAGGDFIVSGNLLDDDDLFTGSYFIQQMNTSNSVTGTYNNGWLFFDQQAFIVELNLDDTGRTFTAVPTPASMFNLPEMEFHLSFIESSDGYFVYMTEDVTFSVGCSSTGIAYGSATEIEGSYDPENDYEFTFGVRDNSLGDCGLPHHDIQFIATKESSVFRKTTNAPMLGNIARFDGENWVALGSGFDNEVRTVEVINDELYAGGDFTGSDSRVVNRIAKWSGSEWEPLGDGFNGTVNALSYYESQVIAGGTFTISGSQEILRIAAWNAEEEKWDQQGQGFNSTVNDLTVYDGQLYAAGSLEGSGEESFTGLAVWNPSVSDWEQAIVEETDQFSAILSMHPINGKLAISGELFDWDSAIAHFALYNGTALEPAAGFNTGLKGLFGGLGAGTGGIGMQVFNYNDQIIVGGSFDRAGNAVSKNVAMWNGSDWSPMGDGLPANVRSFTTYNGQLLAGVNMLDSEVHSWDESASEWNLFAGNTGLNTIWSMVVHNDSLYVAGSNNLRESLIIRWNPGTQEWNEAGEGLDGFWVRSLLVYNGELYAGGRFSGIEGAELNNVARLNEDHNFWWPVSNGFSGDVRSLIEYQGDLYAAGSMTASGIQGIDGVARWNKNLGDWVNVGNEILASTLITELSVYNDVLYASGFSDAGNQEGVFKEYDPDTNEWLQIGSRANSSPYNAVGLDGILHIAGFFDEIGGISASGFVTYDTGTGTFTDETHTIIPEKFVLQQNYPNPFNPSTVIEFELPVASNVQLVVYDMLGRRVAVLENGMRTAGRHQVSFDASSLSSGMYIYRIQAGEFVETRKMILVK